jgi:hypothetical protein
MSFLKTVFITAALLTSGLAHAGEREFRVFFNELEGRWQGRGQKIELLTDGSRKTTDYSLEWDTDSGFDDTWQTQTECKTEGGTTSFSDIRFRIVDDSLFISSHSPNDPAEILENTETALSWRSYRTDWALRRTFVFVYKIEFRSRTRASYSETVTFNGKTIESQSATLKRR